MIKVRNVVLSVVLIGTCALRSSAQQLLFSGFETWVDEMPEGFFGTHTDMPGDRIYQIIFTPRSGARALGLELGAEPEARITTLPLEVEAGALYDLRFWVRGQGRLRTTIHDGRPENDGYAPHNNTIEVNSPDAYQPVLQRILATNSSTSAEFVIAVEGTNEGDLFMIDDLYVTESTLTTPLPATIADIQETTTLSGYSPLEFSFVRTQGIVTGIGEFSFFIQDAPGGWNGIQVRSAPPATLAVGDSITVLATVAEAGGIDEFWERTVTQLIGVELLQVHGSGRPLPEPAPITATEARREEWEGVRAHIADLECMNLPEPLVGEWTAANWLGTIVVDDLLYSTWPTVGAFYSVTGIIHYAGEPQLLPVGPSDVENGVGIIELGGSQLHVFPVPAYDVVNVLHTSSTAPLRYVVMDAQGRVVLQGSWSKNSNVLDVAQLANGTYMLCVQDGAKRQSRRLIVQH
ncbi:MAG: T9SS type A sorting domain-containing protein [Flavobacteriales bacterium]|nr:T9SS type A sorting domain-containing protein [Flavobacteriales bacterium]